MVQANKIANQLLFYYKEIAGKSKNLGRCAGGVDTLVYTTGRLLKLAICVRFKIEPKDLGFRWSP